jgi:hypothetical protein
MKDGLILAGEGQRLVSRRHLVQGARRPRFSLLPLQTRRDEAGNSPYMEVGNEKANKELAREFSDRLLDP